MKEAMLLSVGIFIGWAACFLYSQHLIERYRDKVKRLREALPKHELLPARKPGDIVRMHALKMGNGKLMYEVREEVISHRSHSLGPLFHTILVKDEHGENRWEDYSRAMAVYEKRHAEVLAETIIFDVPLTIKV